MRISKKQEPAQPKPRFRIVEEQQLRFGFLYVVEDTKTGVCYLTKPGNDCPFTPLLDADGRPVTLSEG